MDALKKYNVNDALIKIYYYLLALQASSRFSNLKV